MTLDSNHRSRLEALEALEKAATKRPWSIEEDEFGLYLESPGQGGYIVKFSRADYDVNDAALIVEARNLLPALIAVAKAARQAYAILGPRIEMPCTCDGCDCENAMAAAELQDALALLDEGDAR